MFTGKKMVHIGLIIPHQYKLLSVAAILDVFETVNKFYTSNGKEEPFRVSLFHIPGEKTADKVFSGYQLQSITAGEEPELILVPSFSSDDIRQTIQLNRAFIPWLIARYESGAELATFCTGAFLLAATGLLDGKIATTHVDACPGFSAAFPAVNLRGDKTVTQDGRLYTSGGATSTFHLLLHLVNKFCGQDITVKVAKKFAIDMDRESQTYFSTFQPSRAHNDLLVATAQQQIETRYHDTGTIEEMIRDIPSSRRNIVRRFKVATGITPIEYLQLTRIEAAKRLLEQTSQQMSEVILNSGYNDPKAFRKIFRKTVGMTPSEYREKFQAR